MLVDLSDVLERGLSEIKKEIPLEVTCFSVGDRTFPILHKEVVDLTVIHIRDKQLSLQADTVLSMEMPCDRCLKGVEQRLQLQIRRKVDLAKEDGELSEDFDESAAWITDHCLDLEKLVCQAILEELPGKVLCKEDCKGICSVCGQDLNLADCGCQPEPLDRRMSELLSKCREV